jgi:predicted dehydrogenase
VAGGVLGRVVRAEAVFTGSTPYAPGTLRHEPALGGGALLDLGCYPVHWLRTLFPEPLEVTAAEARLNPAGADVSIEAELAFGAMPALVPA